MTLFLTAKQKKMQVSDSIEIDKEKTTQVIEYIENIEVEATPVAQSDVVVVEENSQTALEVTAQVQVDKKKIHTPFSQLDVRMLDKDLSPDEQVEWNSIYASFRSKSMLSGEVIGVDENQFTVTNAITGEQELKKIMSLVIIGYRVKILIPQSEIWISGDEKPDYVARSMIGAKVDFVITNIDREGEVAIGSRSLVLTKKRRSFSTMRTGNQEGDKVTCNMLVVGPSRCLVECGGYDVSLSQRDLSYSAIADLRDEYHTGQELKAIIKSFLPKDEHIVISVKEVNPNPFDGAGHRHPIASRRQAIINGKYKGGIFCTLSDKTVCLCLYSNSHFDTEFYMGDKVLIQIVQYDFKKKLIYGRIVTKM